jgi:hypothetical protein
MQLIKEKQVGFGSHFRVKRRRFCFEYHHHYFIKEASEQSMTVLHMRKISSFRIGCEEVVVYFSTFEDPKALLDFDLGVELLHTDEVPSPANKLAFEAILSRMEEVMSSDYIDYSLISPEKMYCESMVTYILTGEKEHTEVQEFFVKNGMLGILFILLVDCCCGAINGVKNGIKYVNGCMPTCLVK